MIFHTGDAPIESFIDETNTLARLGYKASRLLWSGCIDAPDYLPAGSHVSVTEGDEGDGDFAAPRSIPRPRH